MKEKAHTKKCVNYLQRQLARKTQVFNRCRCKKQAEKKTPGSGKMRPKLKTVAESKQDMSKKRGRKSGTELENEKRD